MKPRSRVTKSCLVCGKSFEVVPSKASKLKHCSNACKGLSYRGPRAGTNNPRLRVFLNGKTVYEHRLIMERHLGRPLARGEVVHHRDGDVRNNRLDNLVVLQTHQAHKAEHRTTYRSDTEQECSKCHTVKSMSEFRDYRCRGRHLHQSWCKACEIRRINDRARERNAERPTLPEVS